MSVRPRPSRAALYALTVAGSAAAFATAASTASAATDSVKPTITGATITPRKVCLGIRSVQSVTREIDFTVSEPATIKAQFVGAKYSLIPYTYLTASVTVAAAGHVHLWTGQVAEDPTHERSLWIGDPTLDTGYYSLEAIDAAGNHSRVRWLPPVYNGVEASANPDGYFPTHGCAWR